MKKVFNKKPLLICALLALILVPLAAGEIKYIDIRKIENIASYEDEFLFAVNNEEYYESYMPDDYWTAPLSKAEYAAQLTALYDAMEAYPEPDNQEYLLLKGIICEYLYNLDENDFILLGKAAFTAVQELPSYDYRCLWFLGKMYVDAARISDGIDCFETIFAAIPREQLHPDLFLYSARAYYMAQMLNHALRDYETYEQLSGMSIQNNPLYQQVKRSLKTYDAMNSNAPDLLQWRSKNGQKGFQATAFGIWIACRDDWSVRSSTFSPGQYIFAANSPKIRVSGGTITYTTMVVSNLSQTIENTTAYAMYLMCLDQYGAYPADDLVPGRTDMTVIEWVDPDMYEQIGGAHGYAALIVRPYTETADCDMEFPFEYGYSGTSSYQQISTCYKRYEGYVVTFVLMDACEFINEQAEADFIMILENSDFY